MDLTRKGAIDEMIRQPSGRNFLPVAALTPLTVGNEVLARLSPTLTSACYDPDDESFNFHQTIMSWGISPFSVKLLNRVQWQSIPRRRLQNYRHLSRALAGTEGCQLLRPELPDYACPLFLPVMVSRRKEVSRYLVRHRIYPAVWWDQRHPAVSWEEFPEAVVLKDTVLALPVHQDLDAAQLDYMANILRRCPALGPREDHLASAPRRV
jgi:hypothetical protein